MDSEKDKGSKIGIGCHFCVGFFAGVGSNNVDGVGGARVGCGMETNRSEAGGLVRLADVGVKPSHSIHFGWRCLRNNRWRLNTSGRIGTCVHLKNPLVTDGKRKGKC